MHGAGRQFDDGTFARGTRAVHEAKSNRAVRKWRNGYEATRAALAERNHRFAATIGFRSKGRPHADERSHLPGQRGVVTKSANPVD